MRVAYLFGSLPVFLMCPPIYLIHSPTDATADACTNQSSSFSLPSSSFFVTFQPNLFSTSTSANFQLVFDAHSLLRGEWL
jgi:hypothetical protein